MNTKRTLFFIEVAILTALALTLDIIPFLNFKLWPAGGSISLAMIPVFIVAFRWGIKGGILSGFLWGALQIAVGQAYILYFWQGFIEYGFAFAALGFAGIFSKQVHAAIKANDLKATLKYVTYGVWLGGSLRFLAHFFAGATFFAVYAPEGQNPWVYSLIYNSSYMIPCMIICTIAIYYLFSKQPRTLLQTTH